VLGCNALVLVVNQNGLFQFSTNRNHKIKQIGGPENSQTNLPFAIFYLTIIFGRIEPKRPDDSVENIGRREIHVFSLNFSRILVSIERVKPALTSILRKSFSVSERSF